MNTGHGDYIVKPEVSYEKFQLIYKILLKHNPIISRKECIFEDLLKEVKSIDENVDLIFIPRTLYELIFMRKTIEEDIEKSDVCNNGYYYGHITRHRIPEENLDNCWHWGDKTKIAYRLNNVILKMLSNFKNHLLTYEQIEKLAYLEIDFLRQYRNRSFLKKLKHHEKELFFTEYEDSNRPPSVTFCKKYNINSVTMEIKYGYHAKIIMDSIKLQCSDLARRNILCYRGAVYDKDALFCGKTPQSLSYGTSLFAGCILDVDATAYRYMRSKLNNAYVICVPFDRIDTGIFYIPPADTISQLYSRGEVFHIRTKVPKDTEVCNGFAGFLNETNKEYRVDMIMQYTEDTLKEFEKYKANAIILK